MKRCFAALNMTTVLNMTTTLIKRCLTSAPSGVDRWFAALSMTTCVDEEMFRCAQHDNYANEEMFRCAQHDSNAIAVPEQSEGYE